MIKNLVLMTTVCCLAISSLSCMQAGVFNGRKGEVKIMTLDPGHFHAALVQKIMYDQVSPTVYVYGPKGPDVQDHLNRIDGFNTRADDPTNWKEVTYAGNDFLAKMVEDQPGNVVVISGGNRHKTEYIKACTDAGLNLLVDKPMCIDKKGFDLMVEAFDSARANNVLLYDIMTERSEITTILQRELAHTKNVIGKMQKGSQDNPAVENESVHHFFKYVSGNPIKRPGWYFDTTQQGEGIVDVTTHLTDLVAWGCFPEVAIDYKKDIKVLKGRRWPTMISKSQYEKVTQLNDFIPELKSKLNSKGVLPCYANGEISYTIKGVHAKVRVQWNYQAPEGAKDTHYSIIRGTRANVVIRQGKEQNYRSELYVEPARPEETIALAIALPRAVAMLQSKYPGIKAERQGVNWHISVPDKYRVGHEAHFGQVTQRYLGYLVDGKLPEWEVSNMIAKYYITTTALEMAK